MVFRVLKICSVEMQGSIARPWHCLYCILMAVECLPHLFLFPHTSEPLASRFPACIFLFLLASMSANAPVYPDPVVIPIKMCPACPHKMGDLRVHAGSSDAQHRGKIVQTVRLCVHVVSWWLMPALVRRCGKLPLHRLSHPRVPDAGCTLPARPYHGPPDRSQRLSTAVSSRMRRSSSGSPSGSRSERHR